MNHKLRHVLSRYQRLMRCALILPVTELYDRTSDICIAERRSTAMRKAGPPAKPDVPSMIAVLERVNYRLDAIEEKIDLLLVPIEAVKH